MTHGVPERLAFSSIRRSETGTHFGGNRDRGAIGVNEQLNHFRVCPPWTPVASKAMTRGFSVQEHLPPGNLP
jgi:hypothetical protein